MTSNASPPVIGYRFAEQARGWAWFLLTVGIMFRSNRSDRTIQRPVFGQRVGASCMILCAVTPLIGGCGTLIGAAVGTTVPKRTEYSSQETVAAERELSGREVRVYSAWEREGSGPEHSPIEGTLVGIEAEKQAGGNYARVLVVNTDQGTHRVDVDNVLLVDAETGSYWGMGMGLGILVDVVVVVTYLALHPIPTMPEDGFWGEGSP